MLGHEIGHVDAEAHHQRHSEEQGRQTGSSAAGDRATFLGRRRRTGIYEMVLENSFDRGDEMDADKVAVQLAQKAGYAPARSATS